MQTHDTQSSSVQPKTGTPKTNPLAPRPFDVTYPGQDRAASPTNPFPRRPHEVYMGEVVSRSPAVSPEAKAEPDSPQAEQAGYLPFSLQAPGQPPPPLPWWHRTQAKLTIGQPNDPYEQEADAVAEQVMTMPAPPEMQRQAVVEAEAVGGAEEETEADIQPKLLGDADTPLVQRQSEGANTEPGMRRQPFSLYPPDRPAPPAIPWWGMQAKLTIGQPNDPYEQESDQVAEQVISMAPPATPNVQRQTEDEEELQTKPLAETITPLIQRQELAKDEEPIQAKCEACESEEQVQRSSDSSTQAQPDLENRLNASQGGGSPLPDDVRSFMEPRFGANFSQVRVHTDSESVQMNRDLNAQAFTHKQDVYFGAGKSPANDALTAHELTHVVQQTSERVQSTLQRKEENNAPLAAIQGLPMYDLLTKLQALSSDVRTDEEAGGFVGGPRLVIAMRAVKTKFDKDLVDFLSINKKGLESLPSDQYGDILRYLGASDNIPKSNKGTANSSASVSQLSTTDKFSEAVKRAMKELPGETANRLEELLTPQSIAVMVSFTAVYIASQVTPAGWIADGIGIALILASAVMIGPEVVTIVEHIIAFAQKASNATNDQDLDSAGHDLAIAVTKIGVDVVMAILLHKAGKSGTKAVKTYVKPAPELVDAVTLDGRVVRVPAEEVSKNAYESRGAGKGGGKVSLVDAIRSIGDDFLDQSEGRGGGHTISEHVSRTNQELVRRAVKENVDATSFDNKSGATAAVRYNLRTNAADIAAWLEDINAANRRAFDASHPMRIGRGVKAGSKTINYDIGDSRIVLVKDATMPLKFRILTGFPLLQP